MAMDKTVLGAAMKAAVYAAAENNPGDADAIYEAMAEAIIDHIQTFAQVNTTVAVVSVSGVTTGPGTSGPGTGSGTGGIV